jgi:hypothetical protein
MNEVRRALALQLSTGVVETTTGAALLALLGSGTNASILAEGEATPATPKPFLVLAYDGGPVSDHYLRQHWTLEVYTQKDAYAAGLILKYVRDLLHKQVLTVDAEAGCQCMECEHFMDTPPGRDRYLDARVEGARYRVHLIDF